MSVSSCVCENPVWIEDPDSVAHYCLYCGKPEAESDFKEMLLNMYTPTSEKECVWVHDENSVFYRCVNHGELKEIRSLLFPDSGDD